MSETVDIDQGIQQGGDQQPISKKAKRDLEAMEGMGGNEKDKEAQEVDKEKKTPTMSKKHNSDDADISIISSDNILFKVHSYRLMTASSVFRDMLMNPDATAKRDPIYMTDDKLENASVLGILLDIMYTLEISDVASVDMFAVLDLADKWDFDHVRHTVYRDLPNYRDGHRENNKHLFRRFHLSIKSKDPSLIAGFTRREHNLKWRKLEKSAIWRFRRDSVSRPLYDEAAPGLLNEDRIEGARSFDVGTWSYGDLLLTPPTVLWALLRATQIGTTTPAKIDPGKIADEFERLLTLAYKPEKADGDKDKSNAGD